MDDDHEVSALFGSGEAMLREALSAKRDECLRLRARLSEAEARCAEVERERDEMRGKVAHECGWCGYEQVGPDGMREHAMTCAKSPLVRALAASQAECARLREYANHKFMECDGAKLWWFTKHNAGPYEPSDEFPCTCGFSLASAPGSTDALREALRKSMRLFSDRAALYPEADRNHIIDDVLLEVLGERAKEAANG